MKFKNHLDSIKATIYQCPTYEDLEKYIPEFVSLTWLEKIEDIESFLIEKGLTRRDCVNETLLGHTLPTALETINLTFFLEGLDLTNVTHVIRHRLFSFSAQSTDPVSMLNHDFLENDAFLENEELRTRSRNIMLEANKLYEDALKEGFTFYDARSYQPRSKECKYFMSGNIKDFIQFINTRLGRLNQPTSDNILALRMRNEILKRFPILEKQMPVQRIQREYISLLKEKMNLNNFPPDKLHRDELNRLGIDYSDVTFNHPKSREDYSHMKHFNEIIEKEKDSWKQ